MSTSGGRPSGSGQPQAPESVASTSENKSSTATKAVGAGKVHSCAPCRIRRVKCERREGADASISCLKCEAKEIPCTALPPQPKKTLRRSGTRLELLKVLYGENRLDVSHEKLDKVKGRVSRPKPAPLSEQAVSTVLYKNEMNEALLSSLLNEFFSNVSEPLVTSTSFKERFDQAGQRMDQLQGQDKVLCAAIIGLAARASDNPIIIGANAPKTSDIGSLACQGNDLSEWGRRREGVCKTLAKEALVRADNAGTFRIACIESISALLILETLVEPLESDPEFSSRSCVASCAGHIRQLLADCVIREGSFFQEPVGSFLEGPLGLTAWGRDCLISAATGRPTSFNQEDFAQLRSSSATLYAPPLSVAVSSTKYSDDPTMAFWSCFDAFLNHSSQTAVLTADKLTRRRVLQSALDLPAFEELLNRLLDARTHFPVLIVKATLCVVLESEPHQHIWRHLRSVQIARCHQSFLALRIVNGRIDARFDIPSVCTESVHGRIGDADDWSYWKQVEALRERALVGAFGAARELVAVMKSMLDTGGAVGSVEFLDWRLQALFFDDVRDWSALLVDMPAAEQGGPATFTMEVKVAELETILHALSTLQWYQPRPNYAETSRWLADEVNAFKQKQANPSPMDVVSTEWPSDQWSSVYELDESTASFNAQATEW